MVELVVFLFVVSTLLAVFFGLQVAMRKLAYPKDKRHMHIRYILVILLLETFVFSFLLAPWLMEVLYQFITLDGVERVVDYMLPDYANDLSYIMLCTIFLNMLMHACTVLLCLLVRLLLPEKSKCFRESDEYRGVEFLFRWIDQIPRLFFETTDGERSVVNSRGHYVGKWAWGIKWSFVGLGALELIITATVIFLGEDVQDAFRELSVSWYLLPMGGFLLADQIHTALSATPSFEIGTVEASKTVTQINAQLEDQIKAYSSTFGKTGALLCSKKITGNKHDKISITDAPGNQQIEDCDNGEMLAVLCAGIKACDAENQSNHYQRALAALLDGKHINVCDQPEGEFVIYLSAYLNFVLSQGRTAVLLCKTSRDAGRLKEDLRKNLYRLNNISGIWSICTAQEANCDMPMNLLICSFDELVRLRLLEVRREFADTLKCVIIAHGERLFAQDHIRIKRLFNEIKTYSTDVQYVLLSETDSDSLRTAMESYMGGGELLPFDNARCKDHTCVMVWQEESCFKLQSKLGIGDSSAPYMGTAIPLALVSAKSDVPMTFIIPAEGRPDDTYWQYMCSSARNVYRYLSNHADAATVIRTDPAEALKPQQLKQLICYDTQYDLINVALGWTRYAGSVGTMLHIVSPHYLLREYFADKFINGSVTLQDHPVEALVPHSSVMKKSKLAALLVDLRDHGMTEKELLRRSKEYGWTYEKPEKLLQKCLESVLPPEKSINIFEKFSFEQRRRQIREDGSLTTETFVRLADAEAYHRILEKTRPAIAQIGLERRVELTIPVGDISNYYLREQQLVLDGLNYKINDIIDGTLLLTQCNDPYAYEYFPVSRFDFQDYEIVDSCLDSSMLNMNIAEAKTKRQIHGYWRSNCGYRIEGDGIFSLEHLDNCTEEKIASVLEINLPDAKGEGDPWKVSATLAFILNGLFKTLFPYNHQNLFAVVRGENAFENLVQSITDSQKQDTETIVKSLIPFTFSRKPENRTASTVYIVEYSCVENGMIGLLYMHRDRILRTVQDYLRWYLSEKKLSDGTVAQRGTELLFGGKTVPAIFAPDELLAILDEMIGVEKQEEPQEAEVEDADLEFPHICTFCGRKAFVMHQFEDGRKICNMCRDHQVTDQNEITRILDDVQQFMEDEYNIRLRRNIHIRFKNADEIRTETNAPRDERRLGFYDRRNHRLLLENGGPRVPMCAMLIHELTRSWQCTDLPMSLLKKLPAFRKDSRLLQQLLDAHASLVEVETMRMLHEKTYADRQEQMLKNRDDDYGKAYRFIREKFDTRASESSSENAVSFMKWLTEELISHKGSLDWNNEKDS